MEKKKFTKLHQKVRWGLVMLDYLSTPSEDQPRAHIE